MHRPKVRATREDYERLPEHVKAEFIDGEIVVTPTPTDRHERLVFGLIFALQDHLGPQERKRLRGSRTEVFAKEECEERVLQPDVALLPQGAKPRASKAPTPVWVGEVLSPSTAKRDRGAKLRLYDVAGVREAWLVDPEAETIEVFDLAAMERRVFAKRERAVSMAIPGFGVDVAALFAV